MSIPQFRIKDAVGIVTLCIKANQPCLIVGAPGIGKSDIVNQIRLNLGMDLILTHPVVSDPLDAKGLPHAYQNATTGEVLADFIPYGDLRYAMSAKKPTLWFIDDLGQAPPAVQAAFMQLLLAREVNGKAISHHIRFVAATNGRQHRANVTGILEPVKSRFGSIFELVPNIDDFCDFAYKVKMLPAIPAFLRFDTPRLFDFNANADMEQNPSPRTWHKLSDILKEMGTTLPHLRQKVVASAVGEGAALAYCTFEKIKLPDIDMLIKYPDTFPPTTAPDVLYAMASSIAIRTTLQNIDNVVHLAGKFPRQMGAMMMNDARSVCPDIDLTDAFGRWSEAITPSFIS